MATPFFSNGSFLAVANQVLWMAAFVAGVAACAVGITYPMQPSAFVRPAACLAGLRDFDSLYVACFSAMMCCTVQAFSATAALWILGNRKRVDKLPKYSRRCCRCFVFISVVFCVLSFVCLVCIGDYIVVIRISKLACLGWPKKGLVVAMNAVVALLGLVISPVGCFIALYGN